MSAYALRGLGGRALSALQIAQNPYLSPGSLDLPSYESSPSSAPMSTPPPPPHLHENRTEKKDEDESKPTSAADGRRMFEGYPPAYFAIGGQEILFDECKLLSERLQEQALRPYLLPSTSKEEEGYKWTTLDVEPHMWHDFIANPFSKKEAERTVGRIVTWMEALPRGRDYVL